MHRGSCIYCASRHRQNVGIDLGSRGSRPLENGNGCIDSGKLDFERLRTEASILVGYL